jgi:tRNA(fMet)-specific endonuclease VapC
MRVAGGRRRAVLDSIFSALQHAPFDLDAARAAARIRSDLERAGNVIGPIDLMIAGTAVSRGAILVTANVKEFSRIRGLRLEDWSR